MSAAFGWEEPVAVGLAADVYPLVDTRAGPKVSLSAAAWKIVPDLALALPLGGLQ